MHMVATQYGSIALDICWKSYIAEHQLLNGLVRSNYHVDLRANFLII